MSALTEIGALSQTETMNMSGEHKEEHKEYQAITREFVESLGDKVRKTDEDNEAGLELYCYVKCDSTDSPSLQQCRGIVFHGENVVMSAFPYSVEFSHTDEKNIEEKIQSVFKECEFYDAHEGVLVRMFNFSGKWYTSTHRKLDAFKSRWATRETFGNAFLVALEKEVEKNKLLREALPIGDEGLLTRFQSILDPSKQYMFLVRHSHENRIVCDAPKQPTLYHVGTFVDGILSMTENIHVPYPRKHSFLNMDELVDYVSKINIYKLQGIIVFAPNNKQYKVLHSDYLELFNARGNEPSIKFRYLNVRMNKEMVDKLSHLYPEMVEHFVEYENILYRIAKNMFSTYIKRHIKGVWSTLPKEDYRVDRICHLWHKENPKANRVSLEKVIEVLNQQPATNLNKMIRRYKEELKSTAENVSTAAHTATTTTTPKRLLSTK
jgi:hypothetical protein